MRRGGGASKPVRVFGYVRVSGREQASDGTSLDAQRDRIARWCDDRGYPAPEVRVEVESAGEEKLERRIELHRLIADARPGDQIVVALLDRWSRDIVFGVQSVRKLVRAGVGWYAVSEQIDATTPQGDEQLGLRMWLAETERRRIRERTVARAEELRAQGLWALGGVPFGYQRGDRKQRRHLLLEEHPEHAPIAREMYQRIIAGQSIRDLASWLGGVPGAPRHPAQIHRLLRSRFHLGEMRSAGEWIRGQHPPLITLDVWELAQDHMQERRSYGRISRGEKTADLLLVNFVRCALCGRRCGVTFGARDLRYYVCAKRRHRRDEPPYEASPAVKGERPARCAGPFVRVDRADPEAAAAVLERIRELRPLLLAAPRRIGGKVAKPPDFAGQRARVEAALARAVSGFTEGALTAAELATERGRLQEKLATIAREEATAQRQVRAADPEARRDRERALGQLERTWRKLGVDGQRKAIRLLAHGVEIDAAGALVWRWRTPEELVAE